MAKAKSRFVCNECGAVYPKWQGQCHECGQWNTLVEEVVAQEKKGAPRSVQDGGYAGVAAGVVQSLDAVDLVRESITPSGISEFDRVLGGGIGAWECGVNRRRPWDWEVDFVVADGASFVVSSALFVCEWGGISESDWVAC